MLGEILGSSAGETSWLLTLPRFFAEDLPLGSALRVEMGLETELMGEATVLARGDGFVVEGPALRRGADFGPLLAETRGVASPFAAAVSMFGRVERGSIVAASGRIKSSSMGMSSPCCSWMVDGTDTPEGESFGFRRMSEAGVAGIVPAPLGPMLGDLLFARMAGDCRAECGFGGGRIRPSESGSGDIESEELAYGLDIRAILGDVGDICVCACISSSSETSFGGMTEDSPDFRFCVGF